MANVLNTSSYPSWHFIDSKLSMVPWINRHLQDLKLITVLDLFGGTGVIRNNFRLQH